MFLLYVLVLLAGCATSTARFPGLQSPSTGNAVIYIYRVDLFVGDYAVAPIVRVNSESIGALMSSGYFRVEMSPGVANVALYRLDKGDDTFWRPSTDAFVNLKLKPNSTHFVEFALDKMTFSFQETSRATALKALPALHLLD